MRSALLAWWGDGEKLLGDQSANRQPDPQLQEGTNWAAAAYWDGIVLAESATIILTEGLAMHVGLIVGIGPAATDFYYRRLIAALAKAEVPLELTMAHADTSTLLRNQAAADCVAQVAIYLRLAERLKAAGASALAITSIAGHFCISEFMAVSPLPIIDLLSTVNRDLVARGLRRVGILGTRVVMETRFYGAAAGTEIIAPAGDALEDVHDAYVAMASSGSITEAQQEVFFSAGRAMMRDHGAEAIMLGGTDLALAFGDHDPGFPTFDCAAVHADAIAAAAMS